MGRNDDDYDYGPIFAAIWLVLCFAVAGLVLYAVQR